MKNLSFYEQQHILRLLKQEGQVKYIFDEFVRKSGAILSKWKENSTENVWIRNATLEKRIENELTDLHAKLLANINNYSKEAWKIGDKKTDDLITGFIKDLAISEVAKQGMFSHNEKAMQAFLNQKTAGFTVSQRVWDIANGAKENLEYYLQSGLSVGRPAAMVSQDIRQLLNDPKRQFRRIRDKNGKLIPSKPMQNYHPGQGMYRSSYKNALRTAATQTNMGYHLADYERWNRLDFVVGIEVERSMSAKGSCPICDAMKGVYSKTFKFLTWHPFCVCQAVPKMLEGEEYTDYLLSGKVPEDRIIKSIPQTAINYVHSSKPMQSSLIVKENASFFKEFTNTGNNR